MKKYLLIAAAALVTTIGVSYAANSFNQGVDLAKCHSSHNIKDADSQNMKCIHCNGTGWKGQYKCTMCKGTGANGSY